MVIMNYGSKMSEDRHCSRIDTAEIKFQIEMTVGKKNSEMYFDVLQKYLSLKVSKTDFDKICIGLFGRRNICLHNRLIQAIVKNASVARTPPTKDGRDEAGQDEKFSNGHQRSGLQSLCRDGFPVSHRKGRTHVQPDHKFREIPSPVGPLGKSRMSSCEDSGSKSRLQPSASDVKSFGSRPPVEVNYVEEGEEVEQVAGSIRFFDRSTLTAPLGIPLYAKETKKMLLNGSSPFPYPERCQKTCMLPDATSLKKRLEHKLGLEGLNASTDCVSLLKDGLDVYLKRLVKPCLQIASSKSGPRRLHQAHPRIPSFNGRPPMGYPIPNKSYPVSVSDLRVAMELNPRILGEDWPLKLEKISLRASEES